MNVKLILSFLLIVLPYLSFAQYTQKSSNTLFSAQDFFSFIGNAEKGEEKLLKMDFIYAKDVKHLEFTLDFVHYREYRINHTLNEHTNLYDFDIFQISSEHEGFYYITSSSKNFLAYKKKMLDFGFKFESEDTYFYTKGSAYLLYAHF